MKKLTTTMMERTLNKQDGCLTIGLDLVANSDWVIDIGPGAGDEGGTIIAQGPPVIVAESKGRTARYLKKFLAP